MEAAQIGALAAGFFWVYSFAALPVGRLADRYGARVLVGLGLVGSGLMNMLFAVLSSHFTAALIVWSANGVFQAMGWTPLAGRLDRWISERNAARVIASFGSCFVAGTALTFALGGLLVERVGVDSVFVGAAVVLIPLGAAWWIGVRDPVDVRSVNRPSFESIGRVLWLLPPATAIGVPYVALIVWTPSYFVDVHQLSVEHSGLVSATLPVVSIAAILLFGRWFRSSVGGASALKGAFVLTMTSAMLLTVSRAPGFVTGFASIAVSTALVGAAASLVLGLFPRLVAPDRVALASGIFALAFNLGGGGGSPIVGRLVGGGDWDLVFVFLAGCVLVGALWSYVWYGKARRVDQTGWSG